MNMKNQLVGLTFIVAILLSCQDKNDIKREELAAVTNDQVIKDTKTISKSEIKVFDDFIYEIGSRFSSIKKSEVENAKTMNAFFSEEELQKMETITSLKIIRVIDDKLSEIREVGTTKDLTKAQLNLLKYFEYDANFVVRADFKQRNEITGELEDNYASPHLTMVPEKQATFVDGKDALKAFLKMSTEKVRKDADPEKFQAAKLYFTVSKDGTIKNVHLDRSCGYPKIDEKMKELISQVPGTWLPAENEKGEKVDQELVVSFGLLGC